MAKRVNPTTADAAPAATPSAWRGKLASTVSEMVTSAMDGDEPAEGTEEAPGEADATDEVEGADEGDALEQDDSGEDDGDDEGAESQEWTGDPDAIPDTLKPAFEKAVGAAIAKRESEMNKGVQKVLNQLQSERQLLQQQMAQMQAWQQQMQTQQAPANLGPQEPGEDASREQWQRYYDERAAWVADQQFERRMAQMRQTGAIPDPNHFAAMRAQNQQIERMNYINSRLQEVVAEMPNDTSIAQEVATRMKELAEGDRNLYTLLAQSDDGAGTVFGLAKSQVLAERAAKKAGATAEETARRGARARNNAVPRLNGVRQESEPDPLPQGKKYRNTREKIDAVIASQKRGVASE